MQNSQISAIKYSIASLSDMSPVFILLSISYRECMDVTKKYKNILSAVPFYTVIEIGRASCRERV